MSLCFSRVSSVGTVLHSFSDLPGLRLCLPFQSRPGQIYDGIQESTERIEVCQGNIATVSCLRAIVLSEGLPRTGCKGIAESHARRA